MDGDGHRISWRRHPGRQPRFDRAGGVTARQRPSGLQAETIRPLPTIGAPPRGQTARTPTAPGERHLGLLRSRPDPVREPTRAPGPAAYPHGGSSDYSKLGVTVANGLEHPPKQDILMAAWLILND